MDAGGPSEEGGGGRCQRGRKPGRHVQRLVLPTVAMPHRGSRGRIRPARQSLGVRKVQRGPFERESRMWKVAIGASKSCASATHHPSKAVTLLRSSQTRSASGSYANSSTRRARRVTVGKRADFGGRCRLRERLSGGHWQPRPASHAVRRDRRRSAGSLPTAHDTFVDKSGHHARRVDDDGHRRSASRCWTILSAGRLVVVRCLRSRTRSISVSASGLPKRERLAGLEDTPGATARCARRERPTRPVCPQGHRGS